MSTALGGRPQAFRSMVKNGGAAVIKKGTIVTWSSVAAGNPFVSFLDGTRNKDFGTGTVRETDIAFVFVTAAGADGANVGGSGRLGVVATDIPAGGFGEIIHFGLCQVLGGGVIAQGDHFTSNGAGSGIDAAATDRNVCGIALEGATNGNLFWAFVNFFATNGNSAAFAMGKAVS